MHSYYLSALIHNLELYHPIFSKIRNEFPSFIKLIDKDPLFDKAEQWSKQNKEQIIFDDQAPIRLNNIFEYLNLENRKDTNQQIKQYPFQRIDLDIEKLTSENQPSIFPQNLSQASPNEYSQLWQKLIDDFKHVKKLSFSEKTFTETFFFFLKRHLAYVPVSTKQQYISLFEHLKVKAAIASCLKMVSNTNSSEPILILCVNISGIQSFIYNIASNKAAKSLKGRSFYLKLLMDSLLQKIIDHKDIDVNIGHIIYNSGGKMYLLLPNIERVKKALLNLEKEIIENILQTHKNRLYVCMDWLTFGYDDDLNLICKEINTKLTKKNQLSQLWTALDNKASLKKLNKFKHLLLKQPEKEVEPCSNKKQNKETLDFNYFFEPKAIDGYDTNQSDKETCLVTGELIPDMDLASKPEKYNLNHGYPNEPKAWVANVVKQQVDRGKELKDADYYITFHKEQTKKRIALLKDKAIDPIELEVFHYLKPDQAFYDDFIKDFEIKSAHIARIRLINNFRSLDKQTIGIRGSSFGFTYYGGNKQPLNKAGHEKNYHELAGEDEQADRRGFKRLGVLRMDVDSLGNIFAKGMENMQQFAAYSTLSTQLDLFFSGYLNALREQGKEDLENGFANWIQILYSGGDDLFIVGRWDKVIEFAELIRKEFKAFIGDKEFPSISGGLTLVGGKFPIAKSAKYAGEAEKEAKKFGKTDKEEAKKNAFCFLGETVSWDGEFECVKSLALLIEKWLKSEETGVSKSLIYKFYQFRKLKKENKQDWKWLSAYYLQRLQRHKSKKSKNIFAMFKKLFFSGSIEWKAEGDPLLDFNYSSERAIDLLCLASRWAELKLRNQ